MDQNKKSVIRKVIKARPMEVVKDTTTKTKSHANAVTKVIKKNDNKVVTKLPQKTKEVYSKIGQTKPTPEEHDPLRKFYTSLLRQNPKSLMAIKYCTEHGLMPKQLDIKKVSKTLGKMKL